MDYVTVRELREKSGEIWQRVEAGEEFVVTRNGKPFALLVHTEPAAVEDKLRALRLQAFGRAWDALSGMREVGEAVADTTETRIPSCAVRHSVGIASRRTSIHFSSAAGDIGRPVW